MLFDHRRDSRRARQAFDGWRAPCKRCGARLVRVSAGRWRLLSVEELQLQAPLTAGTGIHSGWLPRPSSKLLADHLLMQGRTPEAAAAYCATLAAAPHRHRALAGLKGAGDSTP